jgi:bacterial/archaeal transporter family-2 protein
MDNLAPLLVVAAGCSVALQQLLNANLGKALQSAWWAGFVSYLGGTLIMLFILLLAGDRSLNSAAAARVPWVSWTGGIFGAAFIATSILMVPRLGTATVVTLIVVGQLLSSLAFDHFGLLGTPQHDITALRLGGAVFLIIGAALIRM